MICVLCLMVIYKKQKYIKILSDASQKRMGRAFVSIILIEAALLGNFKLRIEMRLVEKL